MSALLVCAATRNRHKLREIAALLSGTAPGFALTSCLELPGCPEVVEDAPTLEANAAKKALEVCAFSGLVTLADDTGLEVDALGGAPGVLSARYAGEGCSYADNVAKLLRELEAVPDWRRTARFRCVLALATPLPQIASGPARVAVGGEPGASGADAEGPGCAIEFFEGRIEGRISQEPRGRGGFGYDPVFYLSEEACTLAELSLERKNAVSHRGRALAVVSDLLRVRYGERGVRPAP